MVMQKKHSRFFGSWFKNDKQGKHSVETMEAIGGGGGHGSIDTGGADSVPSTERPSRRASVATRHGGGAGGGVGGRPPQKSTSHASLTFMKGARKRVEGN